MSAIARLQDFTVLAHWKVILTWLASRLWVVFLVWLLPWVPYDVQLYGNWASTLATGAVPSSDVLWQYPPLTAVPIIAVDAMPGRYISSFVIASLAIDFLIMVALIRRTPSGTSNPGLWLWATAGFWVGPVLLTRLDLLPTALAVAGLLWIHRPFVSTTLIALGAGLKLWPVVDAAAWTRGMVVRRSLLLIALLAMTIAAAEGLFSGTALFADRYTSRGVHAESLPALPFLVLGRAWKGNGVAFGSGTIEVTNPSARTLATVIMIAGVALIAVIVLLQWTGRLHVLPATDVVAIVTVVLITSSRVHSPQFLAWFAGVAAVALLNPASRMKVVATLMVISGFLGQYIYPLRTGFPDPDTVIVQGLRMAMLIAACAVCLVVVYRAARDQCAQQDLKTA